MLDDKEKADGVEEERGELDGGTATETCRDSGQGDLEELSHYSGITSL